MRTTFLTATSIALLLVTTTYAQTTWNGSGDGLLWDDAGNWSNGQPAAGNGAIFNTATSATGINNDFTIASLTFNNGVGSGDIITTLNISSLTVNGNITNNTALNQQFDLIVSAGGNSTWTGPFTYTNNVNIDTRQVTLSGNHIFTGSNINFTVSNSLNFGRFLGTGVSQVSGVTIRLSGAYTGVAGDVFDFTTGSFTGSTLDLTPINLATGLQWNTTNFITTGVLSVEAIPEPATFAALAGLAALGLGALRRRPRSLTKV